MTPLQVDAARAREVFADAARDGASTAPDWVNRVERLSKACETGHCRTHIAFLGTAMLAKAVDLKVDVFATKVGAGTAGAYTARTLAQYALAPSALKLGVNIGVTGREPLNNQPYFRIKRVERDELKEIARPNAHEAVDTLCDILEELDRIDTTEAATVALASFIIVRRKYLPQYLDFGEAAAFTSKDLVDFIKEFVSEDAENGKRAQAVTAGLMDVLCGPDVVETSNVHDPDRHLAGDVGVTYGPQSNEYAQAFEVRDKPVSDDDVRAFVDKVCRSKIVKAGVVAVSSQQEKLPLSELQTWAGERRVLLEVFSGWGELSHQVFFWARKSADEAATEAAERIYERLVELEVSEAGVARWRQRFSSTE